MPPSRLTPHYLKTFPLDKVYIILYRIFMHGIGQNFDEFMQEQGLYDEAKELAAKRIIVLQLSEEMKRQRITKSEIAKRMNTSRLSVDNVLDANHNTSISTLERFAAALGKKIQISLV